ncbi:unnamed protein product [Albugo candida]|uniref:Uncharacterized protein n=1 Tax=Albugo candida TaxID=65357 RepID=A0A024G6Z1_9STRA|nr:unnamed protein product [Albugo candida]|eukprot:CCI42091.1 unnamed protein product [Albugo candida]
MKFEKQEKSEEKTYNIVDVLEAMQEAAAAATKKSRKPSNNITQWSNAFRTNNIRNHMHEQHPKKWYQYIALFESIRLESLSGAAKKGDPTPQFDKLNNLEEHVDDLILGTLFDVDDNDEENQALSSARFLFTPVTEIPKEGEAFPIVANYALVIKYASQLTYVQSLLTAVKSSVKAWLESLVH